jgi:hypothetical protein
MAKLAEISRLTLPPLPPLVPFRLTFHVQLLTALLPSMPTAFPVVPTFWSANADANANRLIIIHRTGQPFLNRIRLMPFHKP